MGIKLVRKSSDVPNITNRDDAKMIRYAYGGYIGVVKGFGEELSLTVEGSKAIIGSGRIVVDGWEIDIDGSGYEVSHSGSSSQYYSVILTINLATETATFRLVSGAVYPDVSSGDDLTTYPNGFREIVTHHLRSEGTVFVEGERIVPIIPYLSDIEKRLEELGFKEGEIKAYVMDEEDHMHEIIFSFDQPASPPYSLIKRGKLALFNLKLLKDINYTLPNLSGLYPEGFTPNRIRIEFPIDFSCRLSGSRFLYTNYSLESLSNYTKFALLEKSIDGKSYADLRYNPDTGVYYVYNFGWEIE